MNRIFTFHISDLLQYYVIFIFCTDIQLNLFSIQQVGKNWIHSSHIESNYPTLDKDRLEQVKKCIYIGLKCVEANRNARPSAREIVNRLNEGGSGSLLDKVCAALYLFTFMGGT